MGNMDLRDEENSGVTYTLLGSSLIRHAVYRHDEYMLILETYITKKVIQHTCSSYHQDKPIRTSVSSYVSSIAR